MGDIVSDLKKIDLKSPSNLAEMVKCRFHAVRLFQLKFKSFVSEYFPRFLIYVGYFPVSNEFG